MATPGKQYVAVVPPDRINDVIKYFGGEANATAKGQYLFRVQQPSLTVTLFKSGKLLIQGKYALSCLNEMLATPLAFLWENPGAVPPGDFSPHIGTDESGKGDYFGPLIVAGVYLDQKTWPDLARLDIRDSKKISDPVVKKLAEEVKERCPYAVVAIGPQKYNELYAKIGNLNKLLAWGHARVIENILAKVDASRVLTDQFGDARLVQQALMEKGRRIHLEQRPRAEEDLAVAAASVVARAEFLARLEKLGGDNGGILPKGAGPAVLARAAEIYAGSGEEGLRQVAKVHFKITLQVTGDSLF